MRIALIGSQGQLASSFREVLAHEDVLAFSHQDLDICDASKVQEVLQACQPDIVINSAAIRKPDDCEKNPRQAFEVNALGARNLALSCADTNATLVHISTDNVFDGTKTSPYLETDRPNPIGTYGVSKLAGELFVGNLLKKHMIIRTSALFGGVSSFVSMILAMVHDKQEIRVVTDQYVSPTYTLDLAHAIANLIKSEFYGTYHVTNRGGCSWYEFSKAIFEHLNIQTEIHPIATADLNLGSPRLHYAVLGSEKLEDLPTWQNALERYLCKLSMN